MILTTMWFIIDNHRLTIDNLKLVENELTRTQRVQILASLVEVRSPRAVLNSRAGLAAARGFPPAARLLRARAAEQAAAQPKFPGRARE